MFKPIYYLGCKASLSETIREAIDYVDPSRGRACDLFAGSGAVGFALSRSRDVTAVDVQEYARVVCAAQLNPPRHTPDPLQIPEEISHSALFQKLAYCFAPLIELEEKAICDAAAGKPDALTEVIEAQPILFSSGEKGRTSLSVARRAVRDHLVDTGLWKHPDSTVSRYYGGVYFSFRQAVYLDAVVAHANHRGVEERDLLLAAALSTASMVVNTVGKQFAQPIRPRDKSGQIKLSLVASAIRDRAIDARAQHQRWLGDYGRLRPTDRAHQAIRGDHLDVLSRMGGDFSVLYADPPYTRDHYSRFYHVLETMCLRDEPEVTWTTKHGRTEPSRGVYRAYRHQSPFCVRSTAPKAFESLFRVARQFSLPLVLSYSPSEQGDGTHPRVVSASDIVRIARTVYQHVDIQYLSGKSHNKHNKSDLELAKRTHAEMLLLCRP